MIDDNDAARRGLSLPVKLVYTLFLCVLAPVYWIEIGPDNFLWSCDVALFVTLIALWAESGLLASAVAVSVLLPDTLWNLDFFLRLLAGVDLLGLNATGYMLDATRPAWLRGLSLFYVFLLPLSLWMVHRLGYHRRAPLVASLAWWALLPLSRVFGSPEKNINWAFGLGDPPQTWLPDMPYLAAAMILIPLVVYLPAHVLLARIFRPRGWGLWWH